jgi:hypothetical protein
VLSPMHVIEGLEGNHHEQLTGAGRDVRIEVLNR